MAADDVERILASYASHHNSTGTDKTTSHAYGPLYGRLFAPMRERARRVLEVGVYSGASVLALADIFVNANVTGVDVTLSNVRFGSEHPRVRFVRVDGTDASAPRQLGGGWDLVLDDASHRFEDQLATFRLFAPLLQPGGMYVIEDINGSDPGYGAFREQLQAAAHALCDGAGVEWHDLRDVKGQFDDIVAVVRARG
jgi:8-demethyl-8-alpha-L-rhamnosyltetracenomycin-C 2'-O-methyltransferase